MKNKDKDYDYGYCHGYYQADYISNDSLFDSGWVTHEKHHLFVSRAIVGVCNAIQAKFPSLEWAILLKGEWTKHGFELGLTYAIPKQTVTGGSVKFDDEDVEKYKLEGYNVVLHSHHNMGCGFSGSDHDTLTDSSFAASLLYSKGVIGEATCSIVVKEGVRVAIKPEIVVIDFLAELPEWIDKVIGTYSYPRAETKPITNDPNSKYWEDDRWTRRRWNPQRKCFERVDKQWNQKTCCWEWEDEIYPEKYPLAKDEYSELIIVKMADGTMYDEFGIPVSEESLKTIGPHRIITEDEDLQRQYNYFG